MRGGTAQRRISGVARGMSYACNFMQISIRKKETSLGDSVARDLIGRRIKALRQARGLSQDDVARLLGFNDRQTVSTIETGTRRVTAQELVLAAEKFGTPLEYFTDPFRLEGEGRFSWRQMGMSADRLIEYEGRASRWIAAYRTLAAQVGRKPPLVRPSLGLTRGSRYEDAIEAGERFAAEDRIVTRRDVVGVEVAARHVGRVAGGEGAGDPGTVAAIQRRISGGARCADAVLEAVCAGLGNGDGTRSRIHAAGSWINRWVDGRVVTAPGGTRRRARNWTVNGTVRPGAVVLVDANVMIEAHRVGSWAALARAYGVETVENCVTETQTGYQRRTREQWIEVRDLKKSLGPVHEVSDRERAELAVRIGGIALDRREESLWAHALGRHGTWFLCGPDRASLRADVRLKCATGWLRWRNCWIGWRKR